MHREKMTFSFTRFVSTTALFSLLLSTKLCRTQDQATMHTVCPVNKQMYLSNNTTLLPLRNIIATSQDVDNNPSSNFVSTTTSPWCTDRDQNTTMNHHVELTFTQPVVIELVKSTGTVQSYVNNFSIQYSMTTSGDDYKTYGVLEANQAFLVESFISLGYFSLERPIVARRLKLVANNGTMDPVRRLCWEVDLFGCMLQSARQIQIPQSTNESTTMPTSAPRTTSVSPASNTTSLSTSPVDCEPTAISASQRQQDILIIVLPAALATIVVVLFIAILSILTCVCITRSPAKERTTKVQADVNDVGFHYDCPRPIAYDVPRAASFRSHGGSLTRNSDPNSMEIKNPVYITKKGSLNCQIPESSMTNDYELIPDNMPITAENSLYRSNSQPSSQTRPEVHITRDKNDRESGYYATIPMSRETSVASRGSTIMTEPQLNTEDNKAASVQAHGYAKVHKAERNEKEESKQINNSCEKTTLM